MHFNAIEAAFPYVRGRLTKRCNNLFNILNLHFLGDFPEHEVGDRGWRHHGQTRIAAVALATVVVKLGENLGLVLMDGTANAAVAWNNLRFIGINKLFIRVVGGVDRLFLRDDESGAAFGALRQVIYLPFRGEVIFREVGEMGGKGNAVGNGCLAYPQG